MITAGEIDLVSAYQMLREDQKSRGQGEYDPVAVVSPTTGDALVYGNAWVSGDAMVYGDARVYGDALVYRDWETDRKSVV